MQAIEIKIPRWHWRQVGGDMDPGAYGGIIVRSDGSTIEIVEIQPVRDYVGDTEALEVGFPFWTKEARFCASDLDTSKDEVQAALKCVGLDPQEIPDPEDRAVAIAEAMLLYGRGDEGNSGWARDVVPGRVKWWSSKAPRGWRYLADEDREFRALQREARKAS